MIDLLIQLQALPLTNSSVPARARAGGYFQGGFQAVHKRGLKFGELYLSDESFNTG
ncbi:hypothetical protein [Pseudomonas sp. AU10]|uniref:hypothetical protein n=1 Tax=Pseudomonas sp. AU10 TaxID=882697 RepID=UPI0040573397